MENSGPAFPLATTGIVPAKAALLQATDDGYNGSITDIPNDKFITSIPSSTAFSIPAIISELEPIPYGPKTLYPYKSTFGAIPVTANSLSVLLPVAAIVPDTCVP